MWRLAPLFVLTLYLACSSFQQSYKLQGSITSPQCEGGYAIGHAGVTVTNESNKVIAGTSTGDCSVEEFGTYTSHFSVALPKAKFYQFKVGTHDGRPYSFGELQQDRFRLDLSLN